MPIFVPLPLFRKTRRLWPCFCPYRSVHRSIRVCRVTTTERDTGNWNESPIHMFFYVYCYTMLYMYYVSLSFFNLVWQRLISLRCCWFVLLQYIHICSDFISRVTKGIIMETLMNINTTSTLYETELLLIRLLS